MFATEFAEILARLQLQIPQWDKTRDDNELLTEIRRAFHTLKGSGRMLNRLALGDYAWAHEDMLNQVLAGDLPRSDKLAELLQRALAFLTQQQALFLDSTQSQPISQVEITVVQHFIASASLETDSQQSAQATEQAEPADTQQQSTEHVKVDQLTERDDSQIIRAMFREELPEQLQTIDRLMQDLSVNAKNTGAAQALERELHTLKGGARMAQLVQMADVAHEAEGLLAVTKQQGRNKQPATLDIELLQTQIDLISMLADEQALSDMPTAVHLTAPAAAHADKTAEVATEATETAELSGAGGSSAENKTSKTQHFDSYLERLLAEQAITLPDIGVLNQLDADKAQAEPGIVEEDQGATSLAREQVRLSASYLDKMIENANMLNIEQHTLNERLHAIHEDVGEFSRTAARLKHLLRSLELETEAQVNAGYQNSAQNPSLTTPDNDHFDPLEMDEYSEIQRLSRALAESLNDLVNIEGDLNAQLRSASEFVKQSLYNSSGLHHDLLATRLVEVAVLAPRLRRILRQTAAELGQKVTLELSGEDLKLDRHLLQRMTAPIEHLLRNAVSHGIEPNAEREHLKKPAVGKISLAIYREENEVVFCIRDDGRGLDSERILQRARAMKLVTHDAELSRQEIHRLILHPGFSTAEAINQIAGRGVGMDVVNAEVKALGGQLAIDSDVGKGATFTIRLPFTMASNPVLFVTVQEQSYALPLGALQGLNRADGATLAQYMGQHNKRLAFNDEDYPVYYLGAALGYEQVALNIREEAMYPLIYTRVGDERIAWVVDSVQGRRDVILQSLGVLFKQCHFYASATITPEGEVVMVPDMAELTGRMLMTAPQSGEQQDVTDSAVSSDLSGQQRQPPQIMVVDDSVTVRKVTEKFLLRENFRVVTARDGVEALEKLDNITPDLLLLDIEMPRMDGFELLGALRSHERWRSVPVIMVSSRTAEKHRSHALQLGANDFLGKPYQDQALLAHIAQQLAQGEGSVAGVENDANAERETL